MTVVDMNTTAALRYCRDLTRRRARNFYHGLKLLPEPQRSSLYAVYAWMRRADDIVDQAVDGVSPGAKNGASDDSRNTERARSELHAFGRATEAAIAGDRSSADPVFIGLRETASRFNLGMEQFDAMLAGQVADLTGQRYERFEQLREYCTRVASSVGLICISIWGYDDERAPALAVDRGIAFQLTNILRDLVEDHDAGRLYLPAEDLERHGLAIGTLLREETPDRCVAFMNEQIERAESYYRTSAGLDAMIDRRCRPTLWAMTSIYHGLLGRMRLNPLQVVRGPRVRLGALNKGTISLRARLQR